jgi:hypothetical protein
MWTRWTIGGGVVSLIEDFVETILDTISVNIQVDNIRGGDFISEEDSIVSMDVKLSWARARSSRSH